MNSVKITDFTSCASRIENTFYHHVIRNTWTPYYSTSIHKRRDANFIAFSRTVTLMLLFLQSPNIRSVRLNPDWSRLEWIQGLSRERWLQFGNKPNYSSEYCIQQPYSKFLCWSSCLALKYIIMEITCGEDPSKLLTSPVLGSRPAVFWHQNRTTFANREADVWAWKVQNFVSGKRQWEL